MTEKAIRDAVHGDVDFDSFELQVINTPEFQRLRGIRQLGLAHLVYPCAQHTRFEHSLGVAQMADKIVHAIRKNHGDISENERRFIRALALIHDLGHIPFGHTLEDERPVFSKLEHHDCEARLKIFLTNTAIAGALDALGKRIQHDDLVSDLIRVMRRTHEEDDEDPARLSPREELFAAIVGNTICADLLDYLARDPYFTGLQHRYDDRIIRAFKLNGHDIYLDLDDGGFLKRSIASEILHLLRLRYTLGERVYYHPTKSAASAMISKAVELSGLSHSVLAHYRDEELLFILENAESRPLAGGGMIQHPDLVSRLIGNLRSRRLYIPAYTVSLEVAGHKRDQLVQQFHHFENASSRRQTEESLAKRINASPEQVIIYCPDKGMATKAALVKVKWPGDGALRPLETLCDEESGVEDSMLRAEIAQLRQKHRSLWQMNVFIDPACIDRARELSVHCQEVFYDLRNCQSNFANIPIHYVRDSQLLQAITGDPRPETINLRECQELMKAHRNGDMPALSVEEIRSQLPRKTEDPRIPEGRSPTPHAGRTSPDLARLLRDLEFGLEPPTVSTLRASAKDFKRLLEPLAPLHCEAVLGRLRGWLANQDKTVANQIKRTQVLTAVRALIEETRDPADRLFNDSESVHSAVGDLHEDSSR